MKTKVRVRNSLPEPSKNAQDVMISSPSAQARCSSNSSPLSVYKAASWPLQRSMVPVTSLILAHCLLLVSLHHLRCKPGHTSTGAPRAMTRMSSNRLRSHKSTTPSDEAERRVLNDLDTARFVIGARWPNSDPFGSRSTDFELQVTVQTETTQSIPAVMRVFELRNEAAQS